MKRTAIIIAIAIYIVLALVACKKDTVQPNHCAADSTKKKDFPRNIIM
nr:hypothetical protein [Mucilaginibacter sp. L294]